MSFDVHNLNFQRPFSIKYILRHCAHYDNNVSTSLNIDF